MSSFRKKYSTENRPVCANENGAQTQACGPEVVCLTTKTSWYARPENLSSLPAYPRPQYAVLAAQGLCPAIQKTSSFSYIILRDIHYRFTIGGVVYLFLHFLCELWPNKTIVRIRNEIINKR